MIWMRCLFRPPPTGKTGNGRRCSATLMATVTLGVMFLVASTAAHAQVVAPPPPQPPPAPVPAANSVDSTLAAGATVTDLGSSFLERLGNQASRGFGSTVRNNPGGGGASEATDTPLRFRTWGEAYGISTTTSAQGAFVGDHRRTYGGVAGLGATVAPGVNVGLSVDQSRTAIDVPLALQSASLDLTQFGFNASVDKGPWTWAV